MTDGQNETCKAFCEDKTRRVFERIAERLDRLNPAENPAHFLYTLGSGNCTYEAVAAIIEDDYRADMLAATGDSEAAHKIGQLGPGNKTRGVIETVTRELQDLDYSEAAHKIGQLGPGKWMYDRIYAIIAAPGPVDHRTDMRAATGDEETGRGLGAEAEAENLGPVVRVSIGLLSQGTAASMKRLLNGLLAADVSLLEGGADFIVDEFTERSRHE
jgi:hypothetical protein